MSGVNYISIKSVLEQNDTEQDFFVMPFYKNSRPLENGKKWGMTLLSAGTMRFRWNEDNPNRKIRFDKILKKYRKNCSGNCAGDDMRCNCLPDVVPLELIHSKTVYKIEKASDTDQLQGDGMITDRNNLVPSVTVADCLPVYFYDCVKGVFGIVHSGWKGTGIIGEAVKMAVKEYGCKAENICAAIGPHICEKCYVIEKDRADYFADNFGSECVSLNEEEKKYNLSLTKANLFVLKQAGVKEENIVVAEDCTCCSVFESGKNIFGSFRRQAAFLPPEVDADTRSRSMTVQAAFVI